MESKQVERNRSPRMEYGNDAAVPVAAPHEHHCHYKQNRFPQVELVQKRVVDFEILPLLYNQVSIFFYQDLPKILVIYEFT